MNIEMIKDHLGAYDGPEVRIMEICGSHTHAIAEYGIRSLISEKIRQNHLKESERAWIVNPIKWKGLQIVPGR